MFTHITVGSNDLAASRAFYDAVLGSLGIGPANSDNPAGAFYLNALGFRGGAFGVMPPRNRKDACYGNGVTIGFQAESPKAVDAFHAAGLAHGGSCEGPPGQRKMAPGQPYGAYLRDPDGNKICAFAEMSA